MFISHNLKFLFPTPGGGEPMNLGGNNCEGTLGDAPASCFKVQNIVKPNSRSYQISDLSPTCFNIKKVSL